jgi:methylated-DNA-[protein]-cysteine S-methyltransferase
MIPQVYWKEHIMHRNAKYYYGLVKSEFGEIIVVWRFTDDKIVRIFLPRQHALFASSAYRIQGVRRISNRKASVALRAIESVLQGRAVILPLDILAWSMTQNFQRRVLRAEYNIPRGSVSTYGRIAGKIGRPGAARAVGKALATNPFPVVIPCHRAVRSDGSLGGYAGGMRMKKRLLEMEGIKFDNRGRVVTKKIW